MRLMPYTSATRYSRLADYGHETRRETQNILQKHIFVSTKTIGNR